MSIEELANSRDGVLTLDEVLRSGMTPRQVQHRVRTGQWTRVYPKVYLVGRRHPDRCAAARAAVAWAGPDAVASGLTAAWWWGLWDGEPAAAQVTVPRRVVRRCPPGVLLRRRDLAQVDRVVLRGMAVTALPLTVLDAAAALGGEPGRQVIDRALQQRVSFAELHGAYCRGVGMRGAAWLRGVLREAADRACSKAERVLHTLLRRAGIDGWVANFRVVLDGDEYWIDVAFVARLLAVEVDGWAWHSDVDRFTRDRRRQNALVMAGWTVLRFTWHDLTCRPQVVVAQIRAALLV